MCVCGVVGGGGGWGDVEIMCAGLIQWCEFDP